MAYKTQEVTDRYYDDSEYAPETERPNEDVEGDSGPSEPTSPVPHSIIVNVVNIIDAMAKRGALEGQELFAVGLIRQRLAELIK